MEVVEKINKFFELGNCEDNNAFEKGFIDLFNIEADINDIEIDEVMKNFMIEIEESGMLEVFLSKMAENKKNIDELYKTEGTSISEISTRQQLNSKEGINSRCQLACTFISDILVRKNLIEEWEKYGSNGDHICSLIKSVNDPEFTKECIKNYKKYELNRNNVAYLISSVKDPEFTKECIKNYKKYELNGYNVADLIESVNDPEFTKECIKNYKKYELDGYNVADLIKSVNDPEFTKECIKNYKKYELDGYNVVYLIKSVNDPEFIKECIENRKKYGLYSDDAIDLIKSVNDPEFTKECIKNYKKYELNGYNVAYLIKSVNDPEFTKECIKNYKKYELNCYNVAYLIKSVNDPEFTKECIKNYKKNELDGYNVADLIKSVNDPEFTKECIKNYKKYKLNGYNVADLIKSVNDPEFTKECIKNRKKYGLDSKAAIDLIKSVNDPEFTKECIKNYKKYKLDGDNVADLIKSVNDPEFTKECIKNRKKYGLSSEAAIDLIKSVNDPEFTKECIKNYKKYKLNDDNVADLIRTLNDLEYIKGFVKEQIQNKNINGKNIHYIIQLALFTKDMELIENLRKNCDAKIVEELDRYLKIQPTTLPKEMTIGVEIESEGPCNWENIRETIDEAELDWVAKDDGSLQNGTEVVSTILTESTASMEIFKICQELRRLRQTTSKRCGGHIHIGADYLTDIQDWRNLRTIWNNAEGIFYAISNAKGEIPRQGVIEYASPISKKDETFSETIKLDSEDDLEKYIKLLKEIQGSKYSGINYRNVGSSGKNTIEFRLPNGTINPTTWVENINLFGGLIRTSHELSKIMKKTEEQRTEEEKQMLYNYEILQTETDEKKDAEALIKLCVLPEQVKTYLERYNVNSKLLKHSPEIYKRLKERISTKKIGQKVFTGEERSKWS